MTPSAVSRGFRRTVRALFVPMSLAVISASPPANAGNRDWPAVTYETRPWTRWWWHGSAVDPRSLTEELEALRRAGIGGVEITPIYGVRGEETRFITYLSDTWMEMLEHTLREAARLGMGVDMATGTGWPFGGPWVHDDMAPRSITLETYTLDAGQRLTVPIRLRQTPLVRAVGDRTHIVAERRPGEPADTSSTGQERRQKRRQVVIADLAAPVTANRNLQALALEQVKYPRDLPPVAVVAYGESGRVTDVTAHVQSDGTLAWQAPERATVYAVFSGWHGKLVERAAPGGEGNVIDHFSRTAIRSYLTRFDRAFSRHNPVGIRAFFNDSYEVDDASGQGDWTPQLFDEFRTRRGYDLRRHLPALFGRDTDEMNARVLMDYRETISDLLRDTFTVEWAAWAHRRASLVRNQAHGSPANILDLYAASDIPETEGTDIPRFKWAASAAHVAGRRLVSAEAATWLGEHFRTTLAEVRAAVDHFFVAGVNHIVYHGTAFSPQREPWPGWQFYAAVEFSPQNAWWNDFRALNEYVTRTQSFLQSGRADHDVLLYFPFHDAAAARGPALLTHFGGANRPTAAAGFEAAAASLQARGFTHDYVSDRQLLDSRVQGGRVVTAGGASYSVVLVPSSRYVSPATIEHVVALARDGATVLLWKDWPDDVSGLAELDARRRAFDTAKRSIRFESAGADGIGVARVGRGRVLRGADLEPLLTAAGVARERMIDLGLQFARRTDDRGRFYFVNNRSELGVDGWVPFGIETSAALIFDPMTGRRGAARVRRAGNGDREIYLQLLPGHSLIVTSAPASGEPFQFYRPAAHPVGVGERWSVRFAAGGPVLPAPRTIDRLVSWTLFDDDPHLRSFSGTATYATTFARPSGRSAAWELDLGQVHESARVRLNGVDLGTLIGPVFRLVLEDRALLERNVLEIDVTNLSANHIADLDRRGVPWKKFYNVNMPARLPENRAPDGLFTAAKWEPLDSGLIGPVTLTALQAVRAGQ